VVRLDFGSQQQRSPQYLRVNPKGRVPALVTDRGTLTETPAILQFIAQSHPAARLAPLDDPFELARMTWARRCTSRTRTACAARALSRVIAAEESAA